MRFIDILKRSKGETVVINNHEERQLLEIEEDFIVLRGGNPQMQLTEFIPVSAIVRVIRAEYAGGQSSLSIDIFTSGGEQRRSAGH